MTSPILTEPQTHLDLPPVLELVDAQTAVDLPHATWSAQWRPLLARFGQAAETMPAPSRTSYVPQPLARRLRHKYNLLRHGNDGHDYTITWHVPVRAIRDRGLRREMKQFAEAFYAYEPPAQDAVVLTGMLDGLGQGTLHLFGWLRAALAELSAPTSSIASPTGAAGDEDGSFAPHSDMWIPALLFNVFEHVVPGQGATLLLPMKEALAVAEAAGVPDPVRAQMREAIEEAGDCDYFDAFNGCLYDDHPWTDGVRRALFDASVQVPMGPGQGYLVNDRAWLHGRTTLLPDALPEELKNRRLYRLAYNNERLQAAASQRKVDWDAIGRAAKQC